MCVTCSCAQSLFNDPCKDKGDQSSLSLPNHSELGDLISYVFVLAAIKLKVMHEIKQMCILGYQSGIKPILCRTACRHTSVQAGCVHRADICFGSSSFIDLCVSGLPRSIEQTEWPAESCLSSSPASLLSLTASTGKYLTWDKFHITRGSENRRRKWHGHLLHLGAKLSWNIRASQADWSKTDMIACLFGSLYMKCSQHYHSRKGAANFFKE